MIRWGIVFVFLIFSCFGCTSIKRYNAHIEEEISVEKLKKDVDFVHKKLIKNHPKLDYYISQDSIDYKFDSLKRNLQTPLKPNDFFLKIQAVVSELRHGHTDIIPLFKKSTKKDLKAYKNSTGPLSQLTTFWQNDSLYVVASTPKDSAIIPGSVILKIDKQEPKKIVEKYKHTFYGDGFGTTYFQNRLTRNFISYFFNLEEETKDSILYTFSYKGKKYQHLVNRKYKKEDKKEVKKNDTIIQKSTTKVPAVKKLKSFHYSHNKSSNSYARTLSFPTNDSTFAVLKVSTFSYGKYDKDYKEIFQHISAHKVKNLVLDLRNNGGGRLADSYQLFSYFVPDKDAYLGDQLIVNSSSFQRAIVDVFPKYVKPIVYPLSLASYTITSKNQKKENYIKPALSRIPSKNPENVYTGNLYVIINGGSYSASALISSNLKGFNRAYFVGEETGGDANGSVAGLMPNYQLPHSKLKLQIGTIFLEPNYYQTDTIGHGIYPHQEIKTTLEDRIKNVDPQLRWIINDVKNNNVELKAVIE